MTEDVFIQFNYHYAYFNSNEIDEISLKITPGTITLRKYYPEFRHQNDEISRKGILDYEGRYYIDESKEYKGIDFDELLVLTSYAFAVLPQHVLDADGTTVIINAFGHEMKTYMPFGLMANGLYKLAKELVKLIKGFEIPPFLKGTTSKKYEKENDITNVYGASHMARFTHRKIDNYGCIEGAKRRLANETDPVKVKELKEYIQNHSHDNYMCDREVERTMLEAISHKQREIKSLGNFRELTNKLKQSDIKECGTITFTFDEIEQIISSELPEEFYINKFKWYGFEKNGNPFHDSWVKAGFCVQHVALKSKYVIFYKIGPVNLTSRSVRLRFYKDFDVDD